MHVQPGPLIAVAVRPGGSASATVMVPTVGAVPMFDAVNMYTAPAWPCVNAPGCELATARSGTGMIAAPWTANARAFSGRGEGTGPFGQPLDETVVLDAPPGLVEIQRLASPSPAEPFCSPSLATDADVSPLPSVPRLRTASAITWMTRSLLVVGSVSVSLVRPVVDRSVAWLPR